MRKYLRDGQEVEVISEVKDGFLIQNVIYDSYSDEEYIEDSISYFTNKVFDKPPTIQYAEKVKSLKKEIEELNTLKRNIVEEIKQSEERHKETIKKFNKYSELKNLNMFIDGKITHYAFLNWSGGEIVTFEKAVCQYDHKTLKLLTLFGKSKGNLEWRLSEYSDHSGGWNTVIPCFSFEEARQEVQKHIDAKIKEDDRPNEYIIKCAKKYNLKIDKNYVKKCKDEQKEAYRKKVVECKRELKEAEKKLKENK